MALRAGSVLDTSILIADASLAGQLPDLSSISVISVGELHAGVALAGSAEERKRRAARLAAVRGTFAPIPVDDHVASHYGDLLAAARRSGRAQKATDLLIVATAAAMDTQLVTADHRQARLAEASGIPTLLLGETGR